MSFAFSQSLVAPTSLSDDLSSEDGAGFKLSALYIATMEKVQTMLEADKPIRDGEVLSLIRTALSRFRVRVVCYRVSGSA